MGTTTDSNSGVVECCCGTATVDGDMENNSVKQQSGATVSLQRRRYKKIVNVYLDERWHHERKAEFYRKLENQQGKRLVERRKENRSRENAMIVGMEKQHGQLRHLRQKYDEEKKKRVATQHVKWKFVKEKSNDRLQYGLPNDLELPSLKDRNKITEGRSMSMSSSSKVPVLGQKLRRKNEARYEHIFKATKSPSLSTSALKLGKKTEKL